MAGSIRATGEFAQPSSNAAISFVDVRDIARLATRVLTSYGHDGSVYDITGPEALTLRLPKISSVQVKWHVGTR
jgi:uncharacterized protein YbjT (DUF2867 family)